ncbi:EAL and HDOD domain-containing protein [Halanaerobacter jeridensis]|uniref:EAL and modified HD-GYP domain-containing signal transduction protein n=1 Tax=Halanaerobacter jeridensis TaxID=706427 RepID=A0A939BPR5_9FIRM|nr:HDOD domain-containing protein [Halanaerobacter jeridensis]MBM7557392.1 EAL and modified HD-GYP domain-containing signal transduction protein [Halanaerobacter jeridensis]
MIQIESFVARQPIFDREENVCAYELLYREGLENIYNPEVDGDEATSQVLTSSFGVIGIEEITNGNRAFVNFTKELLIDEIATVFNPNTLVVEILEDIEPTPQVLAACKKIKDKGYIIALDDFVFDPDYLDLIDIADIIKVDFMISSLEERKRLVHIAQNKGIDLLAEKVETREELEEAKEMGYSYFQGYFFSKPVILKGDDLPVYPTNYFQVLNELNTDEPDIDKISQAIERDMSLSYKLLRLINSAIFALREEINSIKQALVLLGLDEVKKWFNLIIINELSDVDDEEVIKLSLLRAKFAESLSANLNIAGERHKFFLMGLFSLIDVLMNRNLKEVLEELPIAQEIKDGLTGQKGLYNAVFSAMIAYEKGKWDKVQAFLNEYKLEEETVGEAYLHAIEWSNDIIKTQIATEDK